MVGERQKGREAAFPAETIGGGAERRGLRLTTSAAVLFVVAAQVQKYLVVIAPLVQFSRRARSDAIGGSR